MSGTASWQAVAYVLIAIVGNTLGGILFPLTYLLIKKK
jgi:membrane protein YqaA with SNARE-associated domain